MLQMMLKNSLDSSSELTRSVFCNVKSNVYCNKPGENGTALSELTLLLNWQDQISDAVRVFQSGFTLENRIGECWGADL